MRLHGIGQANLKMNNNADTEAEGDMPAVIKVEDWGLELKVRQRADS